MLPCFGLSAGGAGEPDVGWLGDGSVQNVCALYKFAHSTVQAELESRSLEEVAELETAILTALPQVSCCAVRLTCMLCLLWAASQSGAHVRQCRTHMLHVPQAIRVSLFTPSQQAAELVAAHEAETAAASKAADAQKAPAAAAPAAAAAGEDKAEGAAAGGVSPGKKRGPKKKERDSQVRC